MTQNQWDQYADVFDIGVGSGGDVLHTKYIDPIILSYVKNTAGKTVVDLGCGNGYLFKKLSPQTTYIGIDSSVELLKRARERNTNVKFIEADISKLTSLNDHSADVVISNMVLQYVPDLDGVQNTVNKILKSHGVFVVIIDHPAHTMFIRAQELAGKTNEKFIDLNSYFIEGKRRKKSLWDKAVLTYYHRTVATYVNSFCKHFTLDRMDEVSEDGEMPRILGLKYINK